MLSPLQERIARIVAVLTEADGFALAGGAALIAWGDVDRRTRDLDFFGPSAVAVDQLLALFGRAEARDFVDLMSVADRYGLDPLFDLAAEKDHGFDARVFAEMLGRIDRLPRAAFPLDDTRYDELQVAVATWKDRALVYAREQERARGIRRERGPGLELGR